MKRIHSTFQKAIKKADKIVITTHEYPDADWIGSEVALCLALQAYGKKSICVNEEPLLERYKYLDSKDVVIGFSEYKSSHKAEEIDLLIVVDTNNPKRIGAQMHKLLQNSKAVLFIDHHPCSAAAKAIHCIDPSTAATGQLVGELIQSINIKFTKEMALPLYTAILIDTSSFRYPTVKGDTHRIISALLDTGITPPDAYNKIYGSKNISHMQFLGSVLGSAKTNESEEIAWIIVPQKSIDDFGSDVEDTHAFINHLLILEKIKVACMFRDINDHVKVSFRSAGDVDVGAIAQALGGGGHDHSAATIIKGKLDDVIKQTIDQIQIILKDS